MDGRMIILSPSAEGDGGDPENFYIWGFQPHFATGMLTEGQRIFGKIDSNLLSDVFVVAIKLVENENMPAAVVEPPDHPLKASDFGHVLTDAKQSEKSQPGPMFLHHADDNRGQHWVEAQYAQQFRGRLQSVVRQTISHAYQNDRVTPFVSAGREFRGYAIFTVVLLSQVVRDELTHLRRRTNGDYSVCTSFVDAVTEQFCQQAWSALALSLDGQGYPECPRWGSVFRSAADNFMHTPMAAANNLNGLHNGFEYCNEISALTYEKAVGHSRLLIARRDHPNVDLVISFANPIRLHNYRGVRKILELAGSGEWLVCDSELIHGLGKIAGTYDPSLEDLFTVEFVGHAKWELRHAGIPLMRVEHGIPNLPKTSGQIDQLVDTFERVFPVSASAKAGKFRQIAAEFTRLDHGLVMIVSEEAEAEASRFAAEATGIEPAPLSSELIQRASRIDGAILVSPEGVCYAIGVILDGEVNHRGTAERGARFNSTVRYIYSQSCRCFGVVASDDGTIDQVPKYRPRVSRTRLVQQVEALEQVVKADDFSERQFREHRRWFEKHGFYLHDKLCEQVNRLFELGDARKKKTGFMLVTNQFEPHPDFDESYLR